MSIDMGATCAPKSDQINADDLISGPRTITVTRVSGNEGNPDQPVNVWFNGDDGKPFRPCKSMRRVMVAVWGPDAATYVGRSMTLYRDPEVAFGGMKVGGIRISHMSGIERPMTMALTATRAQRKPYTVQPLADVLGDARAAARNGRDSFAAFWKSLPSDARQRCGAIMDELKELAAEADADRLAAEARAETDRMAMDGDE